MPTKYSLRCLGSGLELCDENLPLENGKSENPAFLRAEYESNQLNPGPLSQGLFRFSPWLPVRREIAGSYAPVTYKSTGLAAELGLTNLYITFSGYWPEKDIKMTTGTFKECEAYSVCARMPSGYPNVLVVASAGNTARAFIHVCSKNKIPLVVVVPEMNLDNLWMDHEVDPCVKLVVAGGSSDYFDAINLSGIISALPGFAAEGGAKNVARRDGMGCTVLSAVEKIGQIPEFYFQAVGSGTGAIAAWEANLRLLKDGRFGANKMRLMVSQNSPFLVIYHSWKNNSRSLVEVDAEKARKQVIQMSAKVLSNRKPPYSLVGGLYDALLDTDGDVFAVDNSDAALAGELFREIEGIDLAPAAMVAVASLKQAVAEGRVKSDSLIMLNITGGGYRLIRQEVDLCQIRPSATILPENFETNTVSEIMGSLFS